MYNILLFKRMGGLYYRGVLGGEASLREKSEYVRRVGKSGRTFSRSPLPPNDSVVVLYYSEVPNRVTWVLRVYD